MSFWPRVAEHENDVACCGRVCHDTKRDHMMCLRLTYYAENVVAGSMTRRNMTKHVMT